MTPIAIKSSPFGTYVYTTGKKIPENLVFFYLRRHEAQRTDPRYVRNRFPLHHANRLASTMQYQRDNCTGASPGVGPLTAPSPSTILISETGAYSPVYTSAILD